jgi:hypothetical protein
MYTLCRLNGFDNILGDDGVYLHSIYNPIKEAYMRLEAINPTENDLLVILGAGAGYLLECAERDFNVRNFLIIEPHPGILQLMLKRAETDLVIDNKLNRIYSFDKTNFDPKFIFEILLNSSMRQLKIAESPYFKKADEDFRTQAFTAIKNGFSSVVEISKKLNGAAVDGNNNDFLHLISDMIFYGDEEISII